MRVVMMMTVFLCFSSFGQDLLKYRGRVGVDIAAALYHGCAGINMEHAFSDRWSVGAEAYFDIAPLEYPSVTESDVHEKEFGDSRGLIRKEIPEFRIHVSHWFSRCFQGAYLSLGALCPRRKVPEMIIGTGYSARIWDRLGVSLSGYIRVYDSCASGEICTQGIEIMFNYYF